MIDTRVHRKLWLAAAAAAYRRFTQPFLVPAPSSTSSSTRLLPVNHQHIFHGVSPLNLSVGRSFPVPTTMTLGVGLFGHPDYNPPRRLSPGSCIQFLPPMRIFVLGAERPLSSCTTFGAPGPHRLVRRPRPGPRSRFLARKFHSHRRSKRPQSPRHRQNSQGLPAHHQCERFRFQRNRPSRGPSVARALSRPELAPHAKPLPIRAVSLR